MFPTKQYHFLTINDDCTESRNDWLFAIFYNLLRVGTLFIDSDDIVLRQGCRYQCLKTDINITILIKTINLHCKYLK